MEKKGIIFDFNRTLFNPEKNELEIGAEKLLHSLYKKNIVLTLISSTLSVDREKLIYSLTISKLFKKIIVTSEKKNEKHFSELISIINADNNNIYVVGDRIKSEIQIGNKLNLQTIWLKKGKFSTILPEKENEKPIYTIKNLSEILNFI